MVETIDFADDDDEDLPPPHSETELKALRMKASTVPSAAHGAPHQNGRPLAPTCVR